MGCEARRAGGCLLIETGARAVLPRLCARALGQGGRALSGSLRTDVACVKTCVRQTVCRVWHSEYRVASVRRLWGQSIFSVCVLAVTQ